MEEPVPVTNPPPSIFKAGAIQLSEEQIFSSSPGFATPAHPIRVGGIRPPPPLAFAPQLKANTPQTILPILLQPQSLRPVAFRTLTKKHNLTITSSGLGALAIFIGKYCGAGWREEGSAEKALDEIAKQWKKDNGGLILDDGSDKKLKNILKTLEPCMSGGKLDTGRLSRTNSNLGGLSRQDSFGSRPEVSRKDSQTSLGLSVLDVQDADMEDEDEGGIEDSRGYLKIISFSQQPRLTYSATKKTLEVITTAPSLMPPVKHRIAAFRSRYHLVHQRLMRNDAFQTTTFSSTTGKSSFSRSASVLASAQGAYKIAAISNLLGRSATSHLLLGLLVHTAAGNLALTDLTGSVVLDMTVARPVPADSAWFCPGMMVLVEGTYQDDGSNTSSLGSAGGVGGQIKGRFIVETIAGPPAERREVTLGTGHNHKADAIHTVAGAGYGWFDFLGTGSEKAVGTRMRRIQRKIMGHISDTTTDISDIQKRRKVVMIGECNLDIPKTLSAIRTILSSYSTSSDSSDHPLAIVFFGSFISAVSSAGSAKGGDSIHYKECFDGLASLLSEFPSLLATTTLVFVPGDSDPWASTFSAGAATILPRNGIPELFTSRIRRAINTANNANNNASKRESDPPGEAVFTSNPARMSLFGPVEEMVLFRDDITGRIRRNAVVFPNLTDEEENENIDGMDVSTDDNHVSTIESTSATRPDIEIDMTTTTSNNNITTSKRGIPQQAQQQWWQTDRTTQVARRLTKLLLDQSYLTPFPPSIRPMLWDYSHALNLYPLPTALVVCDAEAPAFCVTYEGCHAINPGAVLGSEMEGSGMMQRKGGRAVWAEYDVLKRRGEIKELRF